MCLTPLKPLTKIGLKDQFYLSLLLLLGLLSSSFRYLTPTVWILHVVLCNIEQHNEQEYKELRIYLVLVTGSHTEKIHCPPFPHSPCVLYGNTAIHSCNLCDGTQIFCLGHWVGHEPPSRCLCCKLTSPSLLRYSGVKVGPERLGVVRMPFCASMQVALYDPTDTTTHIYVQTEWYVTVYRINTGYCFIEHCILRPRSCDEEKRACLCDFFQSINDDYCGHHGLIHSCWKDIRWRVIFLYYPVLCTKSRFNFISTTEI